MTTTRMLMGASALVTACMALAGGAQSATLTASVYGGGASLPSALIRQIGDCYGNRVPLVNIGSVLSGAGANETVQTLNYFNFLGLPAYNCAAIPAGNGPVDPNKTVRYISTGSGTGANGYYSHDAKRFWGDTDPSTNPAASNYPRVSFAASDFGQSTADINSYANGGTRNATLSSEIVMVAPGVTPVANTTQYGNPKELYGAQIQFPWVVAPVAIGYDPVYKKVVDASGNVASYKFHLKTVNADGSGGLLLDMPTVCKIFTGVITTWADPALKTLNGGLSLKDVTDTGTEFDTLPIELVGRSDNSGTTSIWYRALSAQCGPQGPANPYLTAGSQALPTSLQGAAYTSTNVNNGPSFTPLYALGKYTRAAQNGGVAKYTAFTYAKPDTETFPGSGIFITLAPAGAYTQGRLAYMGADFALPAVANTNQNTYGLNTVAIKVGVSRIEPTGGTALKAFTNLLPPESTSTGLYDPTVTANGLRANPQDWVQGINTNYTFKSGGAPATLLANPTGAGAYPIVGTTNVNLYSCYVDAATVEGVKGFVNYFLSSKTVATNLTGLLAKAGFSAMPKAWITAATQSFLTPTATKFDLTGLQTVQGSDVENLYILTKGAAGIPASGAGTKTVLAHGSQCSAVTVGA